MGDPGVRLRHVLRHAVLPAVTLSGWAIGATISGAVVVEAVFARPGIGSVLVNAVNSQDMPVVRRASSCSSPPSTSSRTCSSTSPTCSSTRA